MATAIIEVVVGEVAGKLGEIAVKQVANQASLLLHFRKDFVWLQKELIKVRGYLQHAYDLKNEPVKNWLADVQDIAFDAEDIIEDCVVQPLYRNVIEVACNSDSLIFRYKMGRRIRKLKDRFESIMKDAVNLKLVQQVFHDAQPFTSHGGAEEWKKSALVERDARPVAIENKVEEIIHLLEDDAIQVIAVVGMGGIGKTFLMQNVYSRNDVRKRFEKSVWLSISQVYSVERLQCDIASHLDFNIKGAGVTEQRAAELIHERLEEKSWLIVLDDVWRVEGVNDLNHLIQKLGIPSGTSKSCKVVVTSRSMEVCNNITASQIYHMEFLSDQDSWNLFRLHAFPNDDEQNKPFQKLFQEAHKVEKECGRLPLAIKTVAASMANQNLLSWESKLRQLKEVSDPHNPIMPILRLSYDALPAVLKPCFLYFSFFGEDVEIDAEYLIYLWIAEGFIGEGKEQWKNGWRYLEQLNNLCLVEVSENYELKKACKVHDLVLDLMINIGRENKCAFTVEEASAGGCRRILLAKKGLRDADISRFKCAPSLRTLSLSQNYLEELPTKSLSLVRALRVIDLSSTSITALPRCIGDFKLLRVLNLSNKLYTLFREVPDCVRKLKRLCFLNVGRCPLPKWIGDLKCLEHLHVGHVDYSPEISSGISKLVSLRTFRSKGGSDLVLKDVAKLIQLQELRIDIANEEEKISLEEGVLAELVNMRHLRINSWLDRDSNRRPFPSPMKEMKDLEYLVLSLFSVSTWICEYGNLRVLKLWNCEWSEWPALETMPNLMKLVISECGSNELPLSEGFGQSGAFPQLRSLLIENCYGLEKLPELQHGAMPRVEVFQVDSCRRLEKIPEGFEHLRSLKLLQFIDMRCREEERGRLEEGGEYWNKIKANNPHVTIQIHPPRRAILVRAPIILP